jgi:hypothetical protein
MRLENWLYTIPLRLRSLVGRDRLDADLDEELRDHLDRQIEENLTRGIGKEEARLANPSLDHRARVRRRAKGTVLSLGQWPNELWCTDYKGEFLLETTSTAIRSR